MFAEQVAGAIDSARSLTRLDDLSRSIWAAMAGGTIDDDGAQRLAEQLHARRLVMRGDIKPVGIPAGRPSIFPPRRYQRTPSRPVAIARRRTLAASGPMPPALACRFTVAELAVLKIVGDEVRANGRCDRTVAEIAARAGCSRTSCQNALREAAGLGLVVVEERRRQGDKNLPNVVCIVSREWTTWLKRGGRKPPARASRGYRVQNVRPHGYQIQKSSEKEGAGAGRAARTPDGRA